jgi:colicin import membrane protein
VALKTSEAALLKHASARSWAEATSSAHWNLRDTLSAQAKGLRKVGMFTAVSADAATAENTHEAVIDASAAKLAKKEAKRAARAAAREADELAQAQAEAAAEASKAAAAKSKAEHKLAARAARTDAVAEAKAARTIAKAGAKAAALAHPPIVDAKRAAAAAPPAKEKSGRASSNVKLTAAELDTLLSLSMNTVVAGGSIMLPKRAARK